MSYFSQTNSKEILVVWLSMVSEISAYPFEENLKELYVLL